MNAQKQQQLRATAIPKMVNRRQLFLCNKQARSAVSQAVLNNGGAYDIQQ